MTLMTKRNDGQITDRDKLFCQFYIQTYDCSDAWRKSNPEGNHKYAAQYGAKVLKRPVVMAYLQEIAQQKLDQAEVETSRLVNDLMGIVNLNPMDIMEVDEDGTPRLDLSVAKQKPEIMRLLKISFGIGVSKDGDRIPTYKVESYDKLDAIDKLIKLQQIARGGIGEQTQRPITVNVTFPIAGQYRQQSQPAVTDFIDAEDI